MGGQQTLSAFALARALPELATGATEQTPKAFATRGELRSEERSLIVPSSLYERTSRVCL